MTTEPEDYVMHFPPACGAAIAELARETSQTPPAVVRTLALMGLHMRAQMTGQTAVERECVAELARVAKVQGRPLGVTPLVPAHVSVRKGGRA